MKTSILTLATLALVSMSFCGISKAQYYRGYARQSDANSQVENQGGPQNVLIILDASYSMNDRIGGNETKFEAAKQVILQTVQSMPPNTRVGLRVYGHRRGQGLSDFLTNSSTCRQTQLIVPISTNNRASIAAQLININAVGATPITYSLQQAVNYDFNGLQGKKTIILVSDGRETCSVNPCDYVVDAVRHGVNVKINTIGFGTHDKIADDQLKCVALSTKGKFYSANNAGELARGLQDSTQVQTSVEAKILPGN